MWSFFKRQDYSEKWSVIYIAPTAGDHIAFYFSLFFNLLVIPITIYTIIHRDYLPIKAKQIWLTAGVGLGGSMFCISYNIINGLIGYDGFLWNCTAWSGWFLVTLGLGPSLSLLNMRLINYHRIFITRNPHNYRKFNIKRFLRRYYPAIVLFIPAFVTGIALEILPYNMTIQSAIVDIDNDRTCDFNFNYLYWVITYYFTQCIISWILYFRMRKIAKSFNEFRLAIWSIVSYTSVVIVSVIIVMSGGMIYPWGRIVIGLLSTVLFNSTYWLIIIPPVYGHIFNRKATLRKFLDNMHDDSVVATQNQMANAHNQMYGLDNGSGREAHNEIMSQNNTYFNNIQRIDSIQTPEKPMYRPDSYSSDILISDIEISSQRDNLTYYNSNNNNRHLL